MLKDPFGRPIEYIRISVIDHCNFMCKYCTTGTHGFEKVPKEDILSFEDIARIAEAGKHLGIKKIRLTGGEPLVRHPLPKLVSMIRDVGINDISITTNGYYLSIYANELKEAGLTSANVSIDAVDPETFKYITGVDAVHLVLKGIDSALDAGIKVKLNTVVMKDITIKELPTLLELARTRNVPLRFIELMPKIDADTWNNMFFRVSDLKEYIEKNISPLTPVDAELGKGPSTYYKLEDGTIIGFIAFFSMNYCRRCNRIRIDSRGNIYPCLFAPIKIPGLHRIRAGLEETIEFLKEGIQAKPEHGDPNARWSVEMRNIGG